MAAATAETTQTPVAASRMCGTYADMGVSPYERGHARQSKNGEHGHGDGCDDGRQRSASTARVGAAAMPSSPTDRGDGDGLFADYARSSGSVVQRSISAGGHRSSVS